MPLAIFVPARAEDLSLSFAAGVDSAAQGAILYRNASSRYAALAAGAAGRFLQTGGAGADPVWAQPDHGALTGLLDDDHTQYVIKTPGSSTRNVIQPTGNFTALALKQPAASTPNYMEFQNSAGALRGYFEGNGRLVINSVHIPSNVTLNTDFRLQVEQGSANVVLFVSTVGGASGGSGIQSVVAVTPTAQNDRLGFYTLGVKSGSTMQNSLAIQGFADEAWTFGSVQGSYMTFSTTPNGSATRMERLRLTSSGALQFSQRSSSQDRQMFDIIPTLPVATDASRTARSVFQMTDFGGSWEAMRLESNGSAAMIGVYGNAAVVQPAAYTQTYAGTSRTMNAYTADDESAAYTGIDNAQAGTVYATVANLNALRVAYENLRAAVENRQDVLGQVLDDFQLIGWLA